VREHARARGIPLTAAARDLVETEELKAKPRKALADLLAAFDRWRGQMASLKHTDLARIVLDESGYTAMWQKDKSPQAHSRLENLKELLRFMEEFETLPAFLEHVALVMDTENNDAADRVTLMTLHAAKGLEFDTVFLPGWEEGLFPHQRSMDENGQAGLEEERRLAYVGLTRARKRAHISFTQNRRVHALWQSAIPSRFIDELPEPHVEVIEAQSRYGGYTGSRFDEPAAGFTSRYQTPGWQRAQSRWQSEETSRRGGPQTDRWGQQQRRRGPTTIEGELVAKSTVSSSTFSVGDRVFHDKFGYGAVVEIDGNKLTVDFEKAGRKKVLESFLTVH
jgi:DNA helicase-2/ATP-dependent DNA helicase PcrA